MNKGNNIRSILVRAVTTLLLGVTATATAWADEEYYNWRYRKDGNQCVITDYTGDKNSKKSLQIPGIIDGATVVGFDVALQDFPNLIGLLFEPGIGITEMPSVRGCSKLDKISIYGGDENTLPASITTIPDFAFVGTAISTLTMPGVTSVGGHAFEGCNNLQSVTFSKDATIGIDAFAKINSAWPVFWINYSGPMYKWEYSRYHHSPKIVINCTDGSKGWCGDKWVEANHTDMIYNNDCLLWEMDKQGNLSIDCVNRDYFWDNYKTQQQIKTQQWNKGEVKTITLNHVYKIQDNCFETINNDNYDIAFKTIYLNPTLNEIGYRAFYYCKKLENVYFDGTKAQWDAVTKSENWTEESNPMAKVHWRCTVTFDVNGHGTAPAAVTDAWSNAVLTSPADPTTAGYQFVGWYQDAACTTAWDFSNDLVPGDGMTLYAKWESIVTDNGSSNNTNLTAVNGTKLDLQLTDRTLYLDGKWNTLCLPFALSSLKDTPLEGFAVMELDTEAGSYAHATGLDGSTLYLNFKTATAIEAGKPYIVKNATPASTLKSIATDGTKGYNNNEGYSSLADGNTGTKWCTNTTYSNGQPWVCQFQTASPVTLTSYTLTTGGDTGNNYDRNPVKWTLEAKVNDADRWTVIDSRDVTANGGDVLPAASTESKDYAIAADKQGTYQYFRFTVSQSGGTVIQLAELALQGTFDGTIIKNPLFKDVIINAAAPTDVKSSDGTVTFKGYYDRVDIAGEDKSILYLGSDDYLYYPSAAMSLNAFRAYFQLSDASAATLKRTVMNFGDDGTTGIASPQPSPEGKGAGDGGNQSHLLQEGAGEAVYDLAGHKVNGQWTMDNGQLAPGFYIVNGRKVIIH